MNDSFVFYKSFYDAIKMLPTVEEKWQAISSLMELGFYNIEADLEDCSQMVQVIYILGEKQIKASVQHKKDGLKGGRPKKNNYGFSNIDNPVKNPPFEKTESNENVNDNVYEYVNENVNRVDTLTPAQHKYAQIIFDIFKDAHLPCANNNIFSFRLRDFSNAMRYIHSQPDLQGLHSDDVIGACKNYAAVFTDESCYYHIKQDFFSFVKSKQFWKFLPANFEPDSWKKYDKPSTENIVFEDGEECPNCHKKLFGYSNDMQKYYCRGCHFTQTYDDYEAARSAAC